jgi:hypothetical protein
MRTAGLISAIDIEISPGPVLGEFLEIMRQWESDKVGGNAAATGMNQVLMASALPRDREAFLPGPSAHVVD